MYQKELNLKRLSLLFAINGIAFSLTIVNSLIALIIGFLPALALLYVVSLFLGSLTITSGDIVYYVISDSKGYDFILFVFACIAFLVWVMVRSYVFRLEKGEVLINYRETVAAAIKDGFLSLSIIFAPLMFFNYYAKWLSYFSYIYNNKMTNGKFVEILQIKLSEHLLEVGKQVSKL